MGPPGSGCLMAPRVLVRALAVLAAATLLIAASAAGHTVASNKRAAHSDALALLRRLQLPAGAAQSADEPTGGGAALADPATSLATTALVDVHRWWRTPGSMAAVFAAVKGHPPRGASLSGFGSGSRNGDTTNEWVVFSFPAVRGVLYVRELVVDVAPLPRGGAGVRADAQVEWTVPRPPRERVPPDARLLTVTRGTLPGWSPPLSATVTDAVRVHRFATALDRLQVVQPVVVACPEQFVTPTITFTFYARAGGPALAQASMPATGPDGECSAIEFTVGGRLGRPLLASPSFLGRAGRILGVALGTA